MLAGAGPDIDGPVGGPDGVLVVFDDDQGVAHVPQPHQRLDQPVIVPLVQADAGLVEHVQHPPTSPDPIWVASRIRCASPPDREPADRDSVR